MAAIATQIAQMEAAQSQRCTLCIGSNTIPNPNGTIGKRTCRDVSMDAIFLSDNSADCQTLRDDAKYSCGCEEVPNATPSTTHSCAVCSNGNEISQDYLSTKVTVDQTCLDLAADAVFHTAGSDECVNHFQRLGDLTCGCNDKSNNSKDVADRDPDCPALMAGTYPFPASEASSLILTYKAEINLKDGYKLVDGMMRLYEDKASRFVSADAAGCNDNGRRSLRLNKSNRDVNMRRNLLTENKVHYVTFQSTKQSKGTIYSIFFIHFQLLDHAIKLIPQFLYCTILKNPVQQVQVVVLLFHVMSLMVKYWWYIHHLHNQRLSRGTKTIIPNGQKTKLYKYSIPKQVLSVMQSHPLTVSPLSHNHHSILLDHLNPLTNQLIHHQLIQML